MTDHDQLTFSSVQGLLFNVFTSFASGNKIKITELNGIIHTYYEIMQPAHWDYFLFQPKSRIKISPWLGGGVKCPSLKKRPNSNSHFHCSNTEKPAHLHALAVWVSTRNAKRHVQQHCYKWALWNEFLLCSHCVHVTWELQLAVHEFHHACCYMPQRVPSSCLCARVHWMCLCVCGGRVFTVLMPP